MSLWDSLKEEKLMDWGIVDGTIQMSTVKQSLTVGCGK